MSEVVRFFGGPLDGQVRAWPDLPYEIEVPLLQGFSAVASAADPGKPLPIRTGRYRKARHTRFGDPWRYEWQEPPA